MDIITPAKIWTFQFDTENELGRWVRRISKGIQADALIVPDRWDECYANVFNRLTERTVYGERKTKKIGEAKVTLKPLEMTFSFTTRSKKPMSFWYWEIMSWRTFRSESSGREKMAMRCFQDGEVKEYEIETFQTELLEIIEAKLTMYTTKLAAGINALKRSSKGGKPRGPAPKGASNNKKKGGPPKGPPPSKGGFTPSGAGSSGSRNGKVLKKQLTASQRSAIGTSKQGAGRRKGKGGVVRGKGAKGARRRPSMGTVL